MIKFSTREAARKLQISYETLSHYVALGKVSAPEIVQVGRRIVHMWTEAQIEAVRRLLPKIANGRKTRYKKKQSALSIQQSAKTKTRTKRSKRRKD